MTDARDNEGNLLEEEKRLLNWEFFYVPHLWTNYLNFF